MPTLAMEMQNLQSRLLVRPAVTKVRLIPKWARTQINSVKRIFRVDTGYRTRVKL